MSKVEVEIKGPIATITLNKPERLNALDGEMWQGVADACTAVDASPDARVAILMGAGGCFCAGLDVKAGSLLGLQFEHGPTRAIPDIQARLAGLQSCFTAV